MVAKPFVKWVGGKTQQKVQMYVGDYLNRNCILIEIADEKIKNHLKEKFNFYDFNLMNKDLYCEFSI